MNAGTEQRKLAAIMFTDMVGYSALSQRDDKLALELLEEHRQLLRQLLPQFNGTEIKTIGDAFLIEFHSALEAAQCAIEIQRALAKRNHDVEAERRIELKIGIHLGDVVHRDGDVLGDGVNIASRIEPLAGAGGICVSMDVERQVRNALEARLEKLAPTELKNISVTMDLFRVVLPWEPKLAREKARTTVGSRSFAVPRLAWIGSVLVFVAVGWAAFEFWRRDAKDPQATTQTTIPEKSIAVLPFENLSDDKNAAYFADGIQDEILTKLASIGDLKVISRTSTAKYKSKPENLKTVSEQLGVATVLEGSVQKAADKVRVNVQLIDARTDSHLWAKTFDRDMKDVFAIQSEVAQLIADSLQAKLSPAEENTVASAPTRDPAAYDIFLKGEHEHRVALSAQTREVFDQADVWYREAIARDPNFALAMAQRVICRMRRHWLVEPTSEAELTELGQMAKQALALAPGLAEAHIALGVFHYYGFRQYEPALAQFQRALEHQPNNSEAIQFSAYVYRRQGQWNRTLVELRRSLEQDPRNASVMGNLAQTYCFLRRWKEVESTARESVTIDPHEATSMGMWLISSLNQASNPQEPLRVLATFPPDDRLVPNGGSVAMVIGRRAETFVLGRNFKAALETWETGAKAATEERQHLSARTVIRVLAGDSTGAQVEAEKACELLEARLREHPAEVRSMRALSWVYLALNRPEDAVRIARQTVALLPPEKDAPVGTANLASLAEILARTGGNAETLDILRRLLSMPAGEVVSIARLKVDPAWDPIRNDAGFQQLLAGKEHVGP